MINFVPKAHPYARQTLSSCKTTLNNVRKDDSDCETVSLLEVALHFVSFQMLFSSDCTG